jgi:hypothetical protein
VPARLRRRPRAAPRLWTDHITNTVTTHTCARAHAPVACSVSVLGRLGDDDVVERRLVGRRHSLCTHTHHTCAQTTHVHLLATRPVSLSAPSSRTAPRAARCVRRRVPLLPPATRREAHARAARVCMRYTSQSVRARLTCANKHTHARVRTCATTSICCCLSDNRADKSATALPSYNAQITPITSRPTSHTHTHAHLCSRRTERSELGDVRLVHLRQFGRVSALCDRSVTINTQLRHDTRTQHKHNLLLLQLGDALLMLGFPLRQHVHYRATHTPSQRTSRNTPPCCCRPLSCAASCSRQDLVATWCDRRRRRSSADAVAHIMHSAYRLAERTFLAADDDDDDDATAIDGVCDAATGTGALLYAKHRRTSRIAHATLTQTHTTPHVTGGALPSACARTNCSAPSNADDAGTGAGSIGSVGACVLFVADDDGVLCTGANAAIKHAGGTTSSTFALPAVRFNARLCARVHNTHNLKPPSCTLRTMTAFKLRQHRGKPSPQRRAG